MTYRFLRLLAAAALAFGPAGPSWAAAVRAVPASAVAAGPAAPAGASGTLLSPLKASGSAAKDLSLSPAPSLALRSMRFVNAVVRYRDAEAAADFLADRPAQQWLEAKDPKLLGVVFQDAADLSDISAVLAAHGDPETLRLALFSRQDSEFASDPEKLRELIDEHPALEAYRATALAAVWDWSTLDPVFRNWLVKKRVSEREWTKTSLETRRRVMRSAANLLIRNNPLSIPRTRAELDAQRAILRLIYGALDAEERHDYATRFNKGQIAFTRIAQAEEVLKTAGDPGLHALLEAAKSGTDVDSVLGALSDLFDAVGRRDGELKLRSPPKAGQNFTQADRTALASFLTLHIPSEIAGTGPGDRLLAFYREHPLKIAVLPLPGSRFAQFEPLENRLELNERVVLNYLKATGRTLGDLFSNAETLRHITLLSAAALVHEGTHQMQYTAQLGRGLPATADFWYDTRFEDEAFAMQALFLHEKAASHEWYRGFYAWAARTLPDALEDARMAQNYLSNPEAFRAGIAGAYTQVPSLERMASRRIPLGRPDAAGMGAVHRSVLVELARRKRLTRSERREEERSGLSMRGWSSVGSVPLDRLKTSVLRAALNFYDPDGVWAVRVYNELREAFDASAAWARERVNELYADQAGSRVK